MQKSTSEMVNRLSNVEPAELDEAIAALQRARQACAELRARMNRCKSWYGFFIVGNEDYAFAVNEANKSEIHHFTRDPDVNDDAFIRACGWAYEPEN